MEARMPVPPAPVVGQRITVRGIDCIIVRILPAFTIDVESVDGSKAFRLTGLYWP